VALAAQQIFFSGSRQATQTSTMNFGLSTFQDAGAKAIFFRPETYLFIFSNFLISA
jgi:hypothetical protein